MISFLFCTSPSRSQPLQKKNSFTRQDSLRGSIGKERAWWDVQHYAVQVEPDFNSKTIKGKTTIQYKVLPGRQSDYMQIDLQQPLVIDSLFYNDKPYINYPPKPYYQEGNVWHIPLPKASVNSTHSLTVVYHGRPREAVNAPWDGGWIWTKDSMGSPWMTVACQGLGASVWYPCKDHQSDEPEQGALLTVIVPDSLTAVGNGVLKEKKNEASKTTFTWEVRAPINTYNLVPYIGKYSNWADTLQGEKGTLSLNYWVIREDEDKAKKQFEQVKPMLRAFEYWFGAYPFYEDGYKLVETPHLGMEHQSAVAYGNKFLNGYLGKDLSGTGWGTKWDYIIVHESGHEWFANNITSKDIADMWVHEGFTTYSEALFTEFYFGKAAANEYVQGLRQNIVNDKPIIGIYGVNQEGSGDMYFKGANMIHTIRQVIGNDSVFRQILRGLNRDFYRQTITTQLVENYISRKSGKDFSKVFDQYLRTPHIPVLEINYGTEKSKSIRFRWKAAIPGFQMPVRFTNGVWIYPSAQWKSIEKKGHQWNHVKTDDNFFIKVESPGVQKS